MKVVIAAILAPSMLIAEMVKLDIVVTDYEGRPVKGAKVERDTVKRPLLPWAKSEYDCAMLATDAEGKLCDRFDCFDGFANCYISAEGYYPEEFLRINFRADYDRESDKTIFSETEKRLEVKLRKINNQATMVYHRIGKGNKDLPARHGRFGFDLKVGDWVAPKGKGEVADFYVVYDWVEDEKTISSFGRIEFVDKGCGAYKKKKIPCEKFPVDYSANKNAEFVTSIPYHSYTDKANWKSDDLMPAGEDEFLVIRSRTSYDEEGNMVGAHYSHIQGPIGIGYYFALGKVFFNPRVNDTNLEYVQPK